MKIILTLALFLFSITTFSQVPEGYYNNANDLSGEQLKSALHNIIKNHTEYPYTSTLTDTWDILKETDKDTANSDNVILFYGGWSVNAAQEYNNNTGWSREHVWAKSHGSFDTDTGIGTDVHNLRPADISVNSARNNDDFDNGGSLYIDSDGATECRTDNDSWEARDKVKGDVARMLMYMAVRYEGEGGEVDLELVDQVNTFDLNETGKGYHGKLSTLLEWHKQDPVDSFEIRRNDIIYSFQENRNPFIDHPEYVEKIWGDVTSTGYFIKQELRIYPNPVKDYLQVILLDDAVVNGVIYSMTGNIVTQFSGKGKITVQTSDLDSGCYCVRIISNDKVYLSKIIIQ